jgi:hypothetical protein
MQYDQQLRVLNDAQLDLEAIAADARANYMEFGHSKQIADAANGMANSLHTVIDEYDRERGNYDPCNPPRISELQELRKFVDHGWKGGTHKGYY